MGQFKPMVKMKTTEPTIELKLKKGGKVAMPEMKKADGGMMMPPAMPARGGMPAAMSPEKPSMMDRLRAIRGMFPKAKPPAMPKAKPPAMPDEGMMMPPEIPARGGMPKEMLRDAHYKALEMINRIPAMRGMPAKAAPAGPVGMASNMRMPAMKKGGDMSQDKSMIKKAFKQHDMQEHKGGKGTKLKLKKGGMACGGMATGGVTNGQGGYATGGVVKGQGGYKEGGMAMVKKDGKMVPDFAADGKGKMKKGGMACATGGVAKGNAGGYKKGGATKKFADGGAVQDDGRAVKMPQGNKKPSSPVSINELSGTFKKGGKVKMAGSGSC